MAYPTPEVLEAQRQCDAARSARDKAWRTYDAAWDTWRAKETNATGTDCNVAAALWRKEVKRLDTMLLTLVRAQADALDA